MFKQLFQTTLPNIPIESFPQISPSILQLSLLLCGTLIAVVIVKLAQLLVSLILRFQASTKPHVCYEIIPPKTTELSVYATNQLFASIAGLLKQQTSFGHLFDQQKSCSFEIVSSKEQGIRYIIRLKPSEASIIKKHLLSYLPGVEVKDIPDSFDTLGQDLHVTEFATAKPFIFPLKQITNLKEYDPIAYVTGTMTKLRDNEQVLYQMVVSPINKNTRQSQNRYRSLFLKHKSVLDESQTKAGNHFFLNLGLFLVQLLLLPLGLVMWVVTVGREGPFLPISRLLNTLPESPYREGIENQIKQKIDQPLFQVTIRLITNVKKPHLYTIEKGMLAALTPFNNEGYQSIRKRRCLRFNALQKFAAFYAKRRLQAFAGATILSLDEVSSLYHIPYTRITKTENLSKLYSKELPSPVSLKQPGRCDIYFAQNSYGGVKTPIGLTTEERRRHMYIIGATGTGKSTMLLSMISQDIENNKGLAVIDPHGDLTEQILGIIPPNRIKDVVYVNPDDIGYPMGINLLELTPGLEPEDELREKEFIAESIISVFHKIYSDKYSGPRMEYILRNTIHTAFTVPDATLFTIYKILINSQFRKSVVKGLTDENLKDFWKYEFAKAGDYQKVKMISPITNKIGRFLFSPTAKRMLEQGKSTINFESILNDGKILLCNLSKGKIGEDNSSVFGVLIMAKIQLAALKRARVKQETRRDFYLYVDEFQNFATSAFAQILSEARKYRLNAILAHQTTSQIEEQSLVNVTLANTGTVVCFRTANPEDERVILPQFQPYIEQGEIASLPAYHFYMRLGALNPEEPFSGVTIPVVTKYSEERVDEVIASSRNLYAKKYSELSEVVLSPKIKETTKRGFIVLP